MAAAILWSGILLYLFFNILKEYGVKAAIKFTIGFVIVMSIIGFTQSHKSDDEQCWSYKICE